MTETADDEKIARLVSPGGMEGLARYGLYWRVNEIIARQMGNSDKNCSVCYPVSTWSRLLFIRGSLVFSALSRLAVTGERQGSDSLVTVERDGDEIRVTNRNLLKYRDEYSKKSRHSQDNVPPTIEGEGDVHTEIEEEDTKDIPSNDGQQDIEMPRKETKLEIAEQVEAIYKAYPRKVGRAVAIKAIHRAVERLGEGSPEHPAMDKHEARRWLWRRATEYAVSLDGSSQDRADFLPHPSTWFNQERYFDDTKEWNRIRAGGNTHVKRNGAVEREAANFAFLQPDISSEPADNRAYQGSNGAAANHQGPGPERIDLGGLDRTIEPVRS